MKKDTHPVYFADAKVTCACGRSFAVGSTKEKLEVEICSACHPFYTGRQKLVDTAGRLEKFNKRYAQTEGKTLARVSTKKVAPRVKKESKSVSKILRNAPRVVPPARIAKGDSPAGRSPKPAAPKTADKK